MHLARENLSTALVSFAIADPGRAHQALVVVMVILGIGIGIALLAICVYIATDNTVTCDR